MIVESRVLIQGKKKGWHDILRSATKDSTKINWTKLHRHLEMLV